MLPLNTLPRIQSETKRVRKEEKKILLSSLQVLLIVRTIWFVMRWISVRYATTRAAQW